METKGAANFRALWFKVLIKSIGILTFLFFFQILLFQMTIKSASLAYYMIDR